MRTTAIEFMVSCTIDGVRYYYGHGYLKRRSDAVRYEESKREQAEEVVRFLRDRGYPARIVRVKVASAAGVFPDADVPITRRAID